jgi:hypothetical protein
MKKIGGKKSRETIPLRKENIKLRKQLKKNMKEDGRLEERNKLKKMREKMI